MTETMTICFQDRQFADHEKPCSNRGSTGTSKGAADDLNLTGQPLQCSFTLDDDEANDSAFDQAPFLSSSSSGGGRRKGSAYVGVDAICAR